MKYITWYKNTNFLFKKKDCVTFYELLPGRSKKIKYTVNTFVS